MVKEAWIGHLYLEIDGVYWSLGCKEGEKKRREISRKEINEMGMK